MKSLQENPSLFSADHLDGVMENQIAPEIDGVVYLTSECKSDSPPAKEIDPVGQVIGEEDSLRLSHGVVSVLGRTRVMEDAVAIVPGIVGGEFSFFAVYSGGTKAVNNCLQEAMAEEIERKRLVGRRGGGSTNWKKVMSASIVKMEERERANGEVGARALTVVVISKEEIVVANHGGDSKVVLCRGGSAIPLSPPDYKDKRVVKKERGGVGKRIRTRHVCRIKGGIIATTSSTNTGGDESKKAQESHLEEGVDVRVMKRSGESGNFLIIASGGFWKVVSNEFACEVANTFLGRQSKTEGTADIAGKVAAMLVSLAMAKGGKANISVVLVQLHI